MPQRQPWQLPSRMHPTEWPKTSTGQQLQPEAPTVYPRQQSAQEERTEQSGRMTSTISESSTKERTHKTSMFR